MSWIQMSLCLSGVVAVVMAMPGLLGGHGGGGAAAGHGGHGGHAQSYVSFGGHGGSGGILASAPSHGGYGGYEHAPEPVAYPKYEYKYGVNDAHTGDVKDAKEERDGDVVKGEYSLLQADGTKRVVHYTASKHGGFNAIVSISGHAIHPETKVVHQATPTVIGHGGAGYDGGLAGLAGHGGVGGHGGATSYASGGLVAHAVHGGHY